MKTYPGRSTYSQFRKKALPVSVHLSESDLLFPCALLLKYIYKGLNVHILITAVLFKWLVSTAEGENSNTTKSRCQIKSMRTLGILSARSAEKIEEASESLYDG